MDKSFMESSRCGTSCAKIALRVAAVLFTIFIILVVAIGVTLIFTQKPVDLSGGASGLPSIAKSLSSSTTTISPLRTRKKFPTYRKFTMEELFSTKPIVRGPYHPSWLPNGSGILPAEDDLQMESNTLNIIPPGMDEEKLFIKEQEFSGGFSSEKMKFSSNGKFVALYKNVNRGFRHSKESLYQVARLSNGRLTKYSYVGPTGNGSEIVQEFSWNPNQNSNEFVFVCDNALYYQADPEKPGSAIRITQNGTDFVHYGITDWLYEEDVFGSSLAHWWSPSGALLAYMKFDDTDVNKVYIKKYYSGLQYPEYKPIPYPKAGVKDQPKIKLYLWNKISKSRVVISPPQQLANESYYIFSNNWLSASKEREERLLTVWANRRQSRLYFTLCNENDCVVAFEQSFTIGTRRLWAYPNDFQVVASSAKGFFTILPTVARDGNIYNYVAHIELLEDGTGNITSTYGDYYDVQSIAGYDAKNDAIFFMAMSGGIAYSRLFRAPNAMRNDSRISCVSCALPNCDSSSASMSPDASRTFITCREAFKDARLYIVNTTNPLDNRRLRGSSDTKHSFDVPHIRHEKIALPSGIDAHVGLMVPPRMETGQKYPLLLHVYGGPVSYSNSLDTPWDFLIYLCSSEQMVIAFVDGRGTGNRGWNIKEPIYDKIGVPEAIDQIDAVKELVKRNDFIDERAMSVFGWSYGGFLATHIGVRDQGNTIRCVLAVAPVADFALYDSTYTERYLGLPQQNINGYNQSRLIDKAANLKNVSFLLAHGEADDNVHYQHSALLSQALQAKSIHFTQLVYANEDHSMVAKRSHLYQEVVRFLNSECMN